MRKKYSKGYKGRIANQEYLQDHLRNFAQQGGATKAVYQRVYKSEECIIKI
jgi:hypothetical protein